MRGDASDVRADDGAGLDALGVSAYGPPSAAVWSVNDDTAGGRCDCVAGVKNFIE